MKKWVYNLEFPSWCPSLNIFGYKFNRVDNYQDKVAQLQHLSAIHSEFAISSNTGQHAITAYVEFPKQEDTAVLEWADKENSALGDILLLLSIFTGRNVFTIDDNSDVVGVIIADPRQYQWGGVLACSIPYKQLPDTEREFGYDIGFEEELNRIYLLMRTEKWQNKYGHGYFLFLINQAFHRQSLESSFTQCWTIWEHLFTVHNRRWLSDKNIRNLDAIEKLCFIMTEYALKDEIEVSSRKRIQSLVDTRNRLIHFGRFPVDELSVRDNAVLFIRLTEFIIAKILGLLPSNVFNTTEKLEDFLKEQSKAK